MPVAMPDGEVHVLAGKVDMMQGGADPQIDAGVRFRKAAQPMHQPLGREIG